MTCPKCGAKLQETSLVCLNCKTFVLPNIPRKAEVAEPAVPEVKSGTDVFKNLVNFVQAEIPPRETAGAAESRRNQHLQENGGGESAEPDINLRQFSTKNTPEQQAIRQPRIRRFGSEDESIDGKSGTVDNDNGDNDDWNLPQASYKASTESATAAIRNRVLIIGGISTIVFIALAAAYYFFFYS